MKLKIPFKLFFFTFLFIGSLSAQDELLEKYLTLADFSTTGFTDIKHTKTRTLINLPFYLSRLSVEFSESSPVEMTLQAKYDPTKKSSTFSLYNKGKSATESMLLTYSQKDALKKALSEHYKTTYTMKSSSDQQNFMSQTTFITTKVLIAQSDVAVWEADELTKFQFPVIEIKDSSPNGGKPTHSITFFQPMQYKGKKDYYSKYGWKTEANIPTEMVSANSRSLNVKGNPKKMFKFTGNKKQYEEYVTFSPTGLRTSSWRWSFDESYMTDTLYFFDTLVDIRYDKDQNMVGARKYLGSIETGQSWEDMYFTDYRWDAEGELLSKKTKSGKEYIFKPSYEDESQSSQNPVDSYFNQKPQTNGLIQSMTYQNNSSREYDYEGVLRTEERHTYSEGKAVDTIKYEYDHRGRLISERQGFSYEQFSVLTIKYNDEKKTRLEKYAKYSRQTPDTPFKIENKLYDHLGNMVEYFHAEGGDPAKTKHIRYEYEYDDQLNWTKRTTTNVLKDSPTQGEVTAVYFREYIYY